MSYNLSSLPNPEIIETVSYQSIFDALREDFQNRYEDFSALVESDPVIKVLEVAAYREVILRARVNDAFKATLLAFADAGDLDNLGAFYGLTRLADETDGELRDRTINRIQGSSTAGGAAWYRYQALTANNAVRDARVTSPAAGEVNIALLSKELENLEALPIGSGNISSEMMDFLNFYAISFGESTGVYNNSSAEQAIRAHIEGAGPLGTATPELLAAVNTICQSDDVRVITDALTVSSANVVGVDVVANVYLLPDSSTSILAGLGDRLKEAVQTEGGLGWDLSLSWLMKNIHVDGVQRVELITPTTNQVANDGTAISLGSVTINNLGYDR